jgi:hypothetical protein
MHRSEVAGLLCGGDVHAAVVSEAHAEGWNARCGTPLMRQRREVAMRESWRLAGLAIFSFLELM